MVPIEQFNEAHLVTGPPECGKSFYAVQLARRIARRAGAYLIAHVVTGTLRGDDVDKARDGAELRRNIAARPGGIHVIRVEEGRDALRAAVSVSNAIAARQGGEHAQATTPVVFLEDEVCSFEGMSPSYLDPELKRAYLMRRHLPPTETAQIGFVLATQRPQMVHPTIWGNAGTITMFRLESRKVARYLVDTCGVPEEICEAALSLRLERRHGVPRHEGEHFVTWDRYAAPPDEPDEPAHQNDTEVDP